MTFSCSACHDGAAPYCAAPSSGALHACPPWQPPGPHPAVQRLPAWRLRARRCTMTYPAAARRPNPHPLQLQKREDRRLWRLLDPILSLSQSHPQKTSDLKVLSVDFFTLRSYKIHSSNPLLSIHTFSLFLKICVILF